MWSYGKKEVLGLKPTDHSNTNLEYSLRNMLFSNVSWLIRNKNLIVKTPMTCLQSRNCKSVGKEIQIILRLFLACHLLLQTKSVPSQPASNVGGLVIY